MLRDVTLDHIFIICKEKGNIYLGFLDVSCSIAKDHLNYYKLYPLLFNERKEFLLNVKYKTDVKAHQLSHFNFITVRCVTISLSKIPAVVRH